MEEFNIENYKDFENVTIAEFVAARDNAERIALVAIKKKDFQTAKHYAKIYFQLNKLLGKKIRLGSGGGYEPRGKSK